MRITRWLLAALMAVVVTAVTVNLPAADEASKVPVVTAEKVVTGLVRVAKEGDKVTVSIVSEDGKISIVLADNEAAKAAAKLEGKKVSATGVEKDKLFAASKVAEAVKAPEAKKE